MGPILLTFFALFPRALFRARWPWAIIWLPALFFVPTFSYSTFLIVYRPPQAHGNLVSGEIYNAGVRLFGLYGITSLATLAARYSSGTFDECPRCGACWDSGSGRCTHDGAALIPVPFSRTLAGRYHMEKRRGRGGTGTVYEAKDEALGRRVAVKVIREDVVCSAAAVQRFQREARAAAGFDHPNVVTVYDYGVHAGTRAFIVMELLDGATLRDELKSHGRLDAARVIEIFRPVCQATDAAHRHHLIHRDLKPENIFLVRNSDAGTETVKILDFGVAKFLDASDASTEAENDIVTESGVLVGTPGYMSPEQLLGEKPAVSWDLWALAVTAYENLTGELPFRVADKAIWRQSVLAGRYTPLSEHMKDPPAS